MRQRGGRDADAVRGREAAFVRLRQGGAGQHEPALLPAAPGPSLQHTRTYIRTFTYVRLNTTIHLSYRQAGLTKTAAAKATLAAINPDVELEEHAYDVTSPSNFEHFLGRLQQGGKGGASPVDLVGTLFRLLFLSFS